MTRGKASPGPGQNKISIAGGRERIERKRGGSRQRASPLPGTHKGIYVFSDRERNSMERRASSFLRPWSYLGGSASGWLVGSAAREKRSALGLFFFRCGRGHAGREFGNAINDGSIRLKSDAAGGLGERCNAVQDS